MEQYEPPATLYLYRQTTSCPKPLRDAARVSGPTNKLNYLAVSFFVAEHSLCIVTGPRNHALCFIRSSRGTFTLPRGRTAVETKKVLP